VRDRVHAFHERGRRRAGDEARFRSSFSAHRAGAPHAPGPGQLAPAGKATDEFTSELAAPEAQAAPQWTRATVPAAARERERGGAPPRAPQLPPAGSALAAHRAVGPQQSPRRCRKSAALVARSLDPPEGATVLGVAARGPVTPRTVPPAPGWSPAGPRSK